MRRSLLAAVLALGLTSPALAAGDPENLQIYNNVADKVRGYGWFTIFDSVHASVNNGVVTLTGKVTQPYKATDIVKRVQKADGVTRVINKIETLPLSRYDDQLRYRIARAIYSHPALEMYGLGANPSIHVIVENGRLTLDGVVNNDMDRQIARTVAGFFGTFDIKNELKTTEEVKQDLEKL